MRDARFVSLSHQLRQRVLLGLSRCDESESLDVRDAYDEDTVDEEADHIPLLLYHVHLPVLERAGYVDWNADRETITRGEQFHEVEPLLEVLSARSTGG